MVEHTELDEVWLVVSPHNPLKNKATLLADYHRLALVREAIDDNPKLKASDIEFHLEKPSYTATTLAHLKEKYPKHQFSLIMGEDNLRTFHKWFNHDYLLNNFKLFVYPRVLTIQEEAALDQLPQLSEELKNHPNVIFCNDAPVMKVSASFIRQAIKDKKEVRYLLTEPVYRYIDQMNFYK